MSTPEITLEDLATVVHAPEAPVLPDGAPVSPPKRPRGRPRKNPVAEAETPKPVEKKQAPEMPKPGVLADGISGLYTFAGFGLMPFAPKTAVTVAGQAEECAKAWEAAAAANPKIRAALIALTNGSVYGALVMAHVPIVLAVVSETKERKELRASEQADADSAAARAPHPMERPSSPVRLATGGAHWDRGDDGVGQN